MSIRGDILDNIKTTLQGISVLNGYNQNIISVSDDIIRTTSEVNEFPVLFIVDGDEKKLHGDVNSLDCYLEVIVTGYVKKENDTENVNSKRRLLMNDIEKIMMIDETRSGKAIITHLSRIVTDRGIIDDFGMFDMIFEIRYLQNRFNPSAQT